MKGVKVDRENDIYILEFESYDTLLVYMNMKRPSQMTVSFDGNKITGAIPVQAYKVRK